MGHTQTVQSQMTRRVMRRLIWVFTVCLKENQFMLTAGKNNLPDTPKMKNGFLQIIRMNPFSLNGLMTIYIIYAVRLLEPRCMILVPTALARLYILVLRTFCKYFL